MAGIDYQQDAHREDFPCPYFADGRIATIQYISALEKTAGEFDEFLASGYRRLGSGLYRNICGNCNSCLPIRIETALFLPSKSQRRTARGNSSISLTVHRPDLTGKKLDLYRKYLLTKHAEEPARSSSDYLNVLAGLHYGFASSLEMDYSDKDRLIAVGIVDEGRDSLSSNYFYYDTDYLSMRPGIFSILQEILLARQMGKRFYYLGFLVEENQKMSYKRLFRPNQVLRDGEWVDYL
jgi:arginine-tRNA-protein transferase